MTYCPHCQTENPDTARFCSNCGLELRYKCPNCQTEYPQGAHYCIACGQPVREETITDIDRLSRLAAAVPHTLEQKIRAATKEEATRRHGSLGERRTVTTLLVDVVGSSALAEELDLETWMEMMNHAFDRITPVIFRYEGTIARLLGDSLLAFFGAPVAHEDDPERAVRAGLDIISQIKTYAKEVKESYSLEFAIRVCINTGMVEIGPVGDDLTYDYTAFGGTVNLTSRIKFIGESMSVLVTGNTYPFVEPDFDFLDRGSVEVKGMTETVRVYQVRGPRLTQGRKRGFETLASPFVGRDAELVALLHLCDAVRAGVGRVAVIVGEPGLGKTRLIQEWQNAAKTHVPKEHPPGKTSPPGYWVTARCVSYGQGLAYQLLIDLAKNLIGVKETSDEPETHAALRTKTRDLLGVQMMDVYPYLGHLLSLKLDGEAFLRAQITDPLVLRNRYLMAMQRFLQASMQTNPIVLVLEDLHWADASSVDIFIKLLPLITKWPILFCLVARPEHDSPGWKLISAARELMGSSLTEISLNSLTEKDSRSLVANLLEIESLPIRVRDLILSKAEGNPYFVEEVIRMLIDHGIIHRQEGSWVAQGEISEHDIPDNLHGLLVARIDRLPTDARQVLLVSSVIGRNFRVKILSQIISEGSTLLTDLSTLESAGLIQMTGVEPDLEYTFRHSLIQDAAYALLLEKDRRLLHRSVGDAIERVYPDRKMELAASLGFHLKEGGEERRALEYFIIAGENALAAYANHEAESQYRLALELTCTSKQETARLYIGLAEALFRQGRLDGSLQAYQMACEIYKSLGESDGLAYSFAHMARVIWTIGDRPESLNVCLNGMEQVIGAPDSLGKARLIHETAREYYFMGDSEKALPLCRQAIAMAEQFHDVEIHADGLATLGILEAIPVEEKLQALQRAIDLAEANGLTDMASRAHLNLAVILQNWKADHQTTMEHYLRSAELSILRGEPADELRALLDYTSILAHIGRFTEMKALIPHLEELTAKISSPDPWLLQIKFIKAGLIGIDGDWETAKRIFYECLKATRAAQNLEYETVLLNEAAAALLPVQWWDKQFDLSELEIFLSESLQIVDRTGTSASIWIYPSLSMLEARKGHLEEAYQWLEKSRQSAKINPSSWDPFYQTVCELEIAFNQQDWTNALIAAETVAEICQKLGLRTTWAILVLYWADLHIRRGEPADLEHAQKLLREAMVAFSEMGMGYYPQIADQLLQVVQSKRHAQTLDHEQLTRELKKARQVQESLLPEKPPEIPGWELAVILEPAHETSGDFYDFISLNDGKIGLVIADVTDKGTSAALFMALSRSLWRTFAVDYPSEPELTMAETNRRILADTHGGLFITLFYGILNPADGSLFYCSAGHHPAFLIRTRDNSVVQLERTGIPLGVFPETTWNKLSVEIEPGDTLVLYTDGITDAQNQAEETFGFQRLQETLLRLQGKPAVELLRSLLDEVHNWMGDTAQFDDITLMVVARKFEIN